MSVFRKPSFQFTGPDSAPSSPGWFARNLKRSNSNQGIEYKAHQLNTTEGGTRSRSGSVISLDSDYNGEFSAPEIPEKKSSTAAAITKKPSFEPVVENAPAPQTGGGAPSSHYRSLKPSNASSAFLSISPAHAPSQGGTEPTPLTSLYLVSGLPKSPQTWTLADPDSVMGVHHSEGAVGRWWRAEVLGSSVSPGVGKGEKKRRGTGVGGASGKKEGVSKADLGKMLSKALKLSFTREVEIIASTLQPASTVHTFTFQLPAPSSLPQHSSNGLLRTSILSTASAGDRTSTATSNFPYLDPSAPGRPSSSYLGPPGGMMMGDAEAIANEKSKNVTYHGVCLTVWSHADEERTHAIRRTLETAARNQSGVRSPKVSAASMASVPGNSGNGNGNSKSHKRGKSKGRKNSPWSGTEGEESESDAGVMSESDLEGPGGAGASTLFLPQNTVFWLPYALTLVSRHPIYDLMRDYLTLSWARFSKDVQSHTLQISKILEYPAPRAGEIIRLDAGANGESMEVVCRFPGGLDFGRGLVDVNFTMWPLFRCLNLDNILTICEIALAPTGRILFLSRHPAMLGIAVSTIKYLAELRGWNGVALPIVHSRDAKIYLDDPGPWIMGLSTEARYITRTSPEICICDLDINYVNCASPPVGVVSVKQQREKFRRILMSAFNSYFHPDHSVPSEFKEAFPAGRFRPLCKIQTKKGASSTSVAENIRAPDWWHQTKVVQAFDAVLKDKYKKPTLLKRLAMMGMAKRQAQLTAAEQLIQLSIRKRASAFVDARDDLETKIGRLSRRLNFLMTESDLWREKFVAFEGYAEKLSAEAAELRSKIGKEQRESKRLSGLVNITAQEKQMLKAKLVDTEVQHRDALVELEKMKANMEELERERALMIEEVEAQIERALASMTFSDGFSDVTGSRPGSAMSSRPPSAAGMTSSRTLRSFGTATTLAEDAREDDEEQDMPEIDDEDRTKVERSAEEPVVEVKKVEKSEEVLQQGDHALTEAKLKRFSASKRESEDGFGAVDQGISERSDLVAQKVLQIQQKLESAFANTRRKRRDSGSVTGGSTRNGASLEVTSADEAPKTTRARPPRALKLQEIPSIPSKPTSRVSSPLVETPEEQLQAPSANKQPLRLQRIASGASLSATRPTSPRRTPTTASSAQVSTPGVTADDSDDSYQSAYSASPYATKDFRSQQASDEDDNEDANDVAVAVVEDDTMAEFGRGASVLPISKEEVMRPVRERVSSIATATGKETPSPTGTEHTVVASARPTRSAYRPIAQVVKH